MGDMMSISTKQRLELQQMLRQMQILGFDGAELSNNNTVQSALSSGLGGTIVFDYDYPYKLKTGNFKDKNIINPQQIIELNRQITMANPTTYRSVDHEGGIDISAGAEQPRQGVTRLLPTRGFNATLSAKQIGDLFELTQSQAKKSGESAEHARQKAIEAIREHAADNARLLSELGFNLVFAPCVDVHDVNCPIIGDLNRAYSDNIDTVIRCAKVQIDEYKKLGIQCVLKHYPGHGRSNSDSHFGITDVTENWLTDELEAYKLLANECGMVMMAHVFHHNIDADLPASISEKHITMLRDDCQFDGIIMLDDIQMSGLDLVIRHQYENDLISLKEAEQKDFVFKKIVEHGLHAGADMFIIGNQLQSGDPQELLERYVQLVTNLVDNGKVDYLKIINICKRILQKKEIFLA